MGPSESQEQLLGSNSSLGRESVALQPPPEAALTSVEKKFLLFAERGDCATVRRLLDEYKEQPEILNINCVDPLNRSALIAAIENENIELIRILLDRNIRVKDALLHAIKEEYVEAVEMLLEWEEMIHKPGEPYSWEAVDRSSSTFTPDITPLILAAHMNNYEILKILLDRGATLPMPHDVRCGCDECVVSSEADSLRHSQARINAYRALTASSLIALSSRDPLLTAFELSWEVRRLSRMENEFRDEYNEMRQNVQEFATSLLDHARTSLELEIMLNHNPGGESWEPGERQTLERLKLAIKYKQKKFVAHPNVQQLLAAIWYEGLPGFRRKSMVGQLFEVAKLGSMFPVYSMIYMIAPNSKMGLFMKKPFVKFIIHSASYAFFLSLLGLASQRVEFMLIEWFGNDWLRSILAEWKRKERGSLPGLVEFVIIIYVFSLMWCEIRSLWGGGLLEYITDLWNIVDFITNIFYMLWIALRFTSWYIVQREYSQGMEPWYPREKWHPFDPMLLSEGAFAAGMIFSFLKLVHIFSVNPHLGPLQISLGRMIIDIIKFFFIYTLVLFAFGCGMNQLLWYYADLEKAKCYHLPSGLPDFDNEEKACAIWRRFTNLFETSQSLFWASFGLVDLMNFELVGIKSFTRFWALLMFGSYSVINIIVLLNMLIAMMSNSYQIISERADTEWKFARSHLWISYFEEGDTVPPPFNLVPTTKSLAKVFGCGSGKRLSTSTKKKSREKALERHDTVMHLLVRRYVTAEQRKRDDFGITEDDVIEIRQDISTLRYDLIDILRTNGMTTPNVDMQESAVGKKGRVMERRLLKDFQIGFVEGIVSDAIRKGPGGPKDVFSKIAKAIGKRTSSKKKDWNAMVRKNTVARDPIGSTTEAQTRRSSRQSLRRYIIEKQKEGLDPEKLLEYNPRLSTLTPSARVAYAKFKISKIRQEYDSGARGSVSSDTARATVEDEVRGSDDVFDGPIRGPTANARPSGGAPSNAANRWARAGAKIASNAGNPPAAAQRPRPRPALQANNVAKPAPPTPSPPPPPPSTPSPEPPAVPPRDFRSRTPIPEEEESSPRGPTPTSPPHIVLERPTPSPSPPPDASAKGSPASSRSSSTSSRGSASGGAGTNKEASAPKKSGEAGPAKDEEEKEKKEGGAKDSGKEEREDGSAPTPSPRAYKPGGKSKVTGQTLTGWL
ncbi:transient receptor potential protein [Schistocerca nitens]|uniref:transient receptor potential protein n=1 Tax=Schistocerca nitens TaxID=7011 RepID=UPI002118B2EE|nr:transient receptor potential protein [Schistocerca nitens]XP_049791464.1 transient receptor potential protein [Schistocerca nitens]